MMVHIHKKRLYNLLTFINTDAVLIDQARKRRAQETFDPSEPAETCGASRCQGKYSPSDGRFTQLGNTKGGPFTGCKPGG